MNVTRAWGLVRTVVFSVIAFATFASASSAQTITSAGSPTWVPISGTYGQNPNRTPSPVTEVPPWNVSGGWESYLLSTAYTYKCDTPQRLIDAGGVNCSDTQYMAQTVRDEAHFAAPALIGPQEWRRNYQGTFSAQVLSSSSGANRLVGINHAENKNEIFANGDAYQNTVNTDVPVSQCADQTNPDGTYHSCWEAYNAFVTMSSAPYTSATGWGSSGWQDGGPIIWPRDGYLNPDASKASEGVRHPQSIVADGYLYVFYLDTSPSSRGIKVARSPVTSQGAPGSFSSFTLLGFTDPSLPAGFDKDNMRPSYFKTGPASKLVVGDGSTISFAVARTTGAVGRYIGVESYQGASCGPNGALTQKVALRVSPDLTTWGPREDVPGLSFCGWDNHRMAYPIFMRSDGRSNNVVDPSGFYLLGTENAQIGPTSRAPRVNKAFVSLQF